MNRFVGVRIVKANSMDLSLFQFDYDMTFAVFFMNADKTIYGRYGTRSEYEQADSEISLSGFSKTLEAALELHRTYPRNAGSLAAKSGPALPQRIPEDFPALRSFRSELDYQGDVVKSCLHCHQVLDAQRELLRSTGKPVSDWHLFPYPMPDVIGLVLDPAERAKVSRVVAGSPAAQAGLRVGDEIEELNGQPIISIADVQWVLHHARTPKDRTAVQLAAKVMRAGQSRTFKVMLPPGWRRQSDILWRATTWDMNRLVGGSLKWRTLADSERKQLGLARGSTALRVEYVGWWGPYQAGKRAGFKQGDVMISFDNQRRLKTVNEFYAYAMNETTKGQRVAVEILRGGQKMTLRLPVQ